MKLSVIIPVYNEEDTIAEIVKNAAAVDLSEFGLDKEIVIVDDGSTDRTPELLKNVVGLENDKCEISVVCHEKNKGKGAAIRTGLKNITGDIVLIQDADSELDPGEYPALLLPLMEKRAKVVFGTRFKKRNKNINLSTLFANKIFTFIANLLYGCRLTDVMVGFKVMHKDIVKALELKSDRFDIEPEIAAKVCMLGCKICEVPVSYRPRMFKSGKKIRFYDSFSVIGALIKYRFSIKVD